MRKEAVIEKLLHALSPHPDLQKPRLWIRGIKDVAVEQMPWPLETAKAKAA